MTKDELISVVKGNTHHSVHFTAIMAAVEAYSSASNGANPIVSGALPPDLRYLKTLIPVAKRELEATSKTIGHEPVVLNRLVQKLEQYMAAMTG